MFGRSISLFKILGFEVKVDLSWLVLAVLITWSLASGLFPEFYKNLPPASYWWMGVAGTVGLFASIVFHELAHSLIARHHGIAMKGITLFIFGGVAEMENDPPSPTAEFRMAVVGPLSSALAAAIFFLAVMGARRFGWPVEVYGVGTYLAWLNLVLAVFNLVPAFPLDGGRILRSLLWRWKKDLRWATSVSSKVGSGFGIILIVLGIISLFMGNFVGGLWWLMLGFFVRIAAQNAYQQMLARTVFHNVKVSDVMVKDPVVVSRAMTLEQFIHDYVYHNPYQIYPVVSFGRLNGCISVNAAARVPRDEWSSQTVGSITTACDRETTIRPDESAAQALAVMNRTGNALLLVVEGEQLIGVISLQDMLRLLSLKVELNDFETK
ncbi:MAG: site-2 protease family protein [Deltaproteobacteria bacterium]|nr:site-2 protease family protein [Deltaproteobacteria bacterium]